MTIILQHSHLIHNLLKLLLIPKPNLINVHKRFYPKGKEVGHASKILMRPFGQPQRDIAGAARPNLLPRGWHKSVRQGLHEGHQCVFFLA